MKIYYLGTCSGTEPMAGMHHCSYVIEVNGVLYWIDAGEGCAFTAHVGGIDVTKTKAIFISHPHIDHNDGLANLLQCIHKIIGRYNKKLVCNNTLQVFYPDKELFDAIKTVALSNLAKRFKYELIEHRITDGVIFEDENVRVSAIHNRHLKADDGSAPWRSFSFLLEAEGKRIVCSGDVKSPRELDAFTKDGADLLIMETGHHKVSDVCDYAASAGVKNLRFNHHGREIIEDREGAQSYIDDFAEKNGMCIKLCFDTMTEEL